MSIVENGGTPHLFEYHKRFCGFSNTIPSMTKSIDDITTPPTFTIINSTIVDSKSQGEVPYISELDIACFSAIDNSR